MLYKSPNTYLVDASAVLTSVEPDFALLFMLDSTLVAEPPNGLEEDPVSALEFRRFFGT